MALDWYKCTGALWCDLNRVNLESKELQSLYGVYMIFTGSGTASVLKVGCGVITKELQNARQDIVMRAFSGHGLFVTWAKLSDLHGPGAAEYLKQLYKPKFSPPNGKEIPFKVNLPF